MIQDRLNPKADLTEKTQNLNALNCQGEGEGSSHLEAQQARRVRRPPGLGRARTSRPRWRRRRPHRWSPWAPKPEEEGEEEAGGYWAKEGDASSWKPARAAGEECGGGWPERGARRQEKSGRRAGAGRTAGLADSAKPLEKYLSGRLRWPRPTPANLLPISARLH